MTTAIAAPRYLLPARSYYDPEWYEREQRLLFGETYNLVGYESDLPDAGSFLSARVGHDPILVVRQPDGSLRAFANVCRHRGMVIAPGDGCADGRFRCSYHGWEYGLSGGLVRVPQRQGQFGGVDLRELGLPAASVGSWAGLIFVHPDPAAMPLTEWLGEAADPGRAGHYPWDELADLARIKVPLRCNWKLYIENHIDNYHLWYLHEASLGMYDHRLMTNWKSGTHWGGSEPLRPGGRRTRRGLPPISGVPAAEAGQLRANLVFPNLPMTTMESAVMTYQVVPTGPESCYLDIRVRGEKGAELADDADVLTVLRDEDGVACEQMQTAIRSRYFSVGPMAREHERWIPKFQHDVLSYLEAGD